MVAAVHSVLFAGLVILRFMIRNGRQCRMQKRMPLFKGGMMMAKKRTKKQNRRADKKRKEMSKARKRNDPIRALLKRTLRSQDDN